MAHKEPSGGMLICDATAQTQLASNNRRIVDSKNSKEVPNELEDNDRKKNKKKTTTTRTSPKMTQALSFIVPFISILSIIPAALGFTYSTHQIGTVVDADSINSSPALRYNFSASWQW